MAEITKMIEHAHGRLPYLIPDAVRRQIGQAELLDRLVHATALMKRAEAARDRTTRQGFSQAAGAVLRAQPRAETARAAQALERKIRHWDANNGWGQAEQARQQLSDLMSRHPMAPERAAALSKAQKESGMVPVFDAVGNLIGLVPAEKITPLTGGAAVAKADLTPADLEHTGCEPAEDDDPAVAEALANRYPLGTPKTPAGEYPSAVPGSATTPVSKSTPPIRVSRDASGRVSVHTWAPR